MFEDKLKNNEERNHGRRKVQKEFILGILFDAVGMLSLYVPCLASFRYLGNRWQHHLMTRMYKGTAGKGRVVTL
jgi:hypothetical protein